MYKNQYFDHQQLYSMLDKSIQDPQERNLNDGKQIHVLIEDQMEIHMTRS
jgi:hypothetical protein